MTELASWAESRIALAARAAAAACEIRVGRRTVSGILWAEDTCISAAEPLVRARDLEIGIGESGAQRAELRALDPTTDVAVLRAKLPGASALPKADSGALRLGEPVLLAGRDARGPLVEPCTIAQIGPAWHSRRGGRLERWIRLGGALPQALEGGAVLDLKGRLVAMAVEGPRRAVLGIPVETISRVLGLLERHGHLPEPYLGIAVQPVALAPGTPAQDRGLMILGVDSGSPAASAGLLAGDILLAVEGQPLSHPIHLVRALRAGEPGQTLRFALSRAGQPRELEIATGERPDRR